MAQLSELNERNRELSILKTIAESLNRTVDLAEALQVALASTAELLGLETGWIWLINESTGGHYLAASQNLPPALNDEPKRMEGRCYCLDTYKSGDLEGAANVNVIGCSRLHGLVEGTEGLAYHASIPLYAHEKKLGILNLAGTTWRKLSPEDLRILNTVGDMLSMAVERAQLFRKSHESGEVTERYRLAREIHDTLGQGLAAVLLKLESIDAGLEKGNRPDQLRGALQKTMHLIRGNLDEARRSVLDLRSTALEGRSLSAALQSLCRETEASGEVDVSLDVSGLDRPLAPRIEASVYRIVQEALNNAIDHGCPTHVDVRIVATDAELSLEVLDDGCGFDIEQPADGYGLIGLGERAKLLGGTSDIRSRKGVGTELNVRIPLSNRRSGG